MSNGVRGWRRRVSGVAIAGAIVAGLASCVAAAPQPTTSPSPEPMFSSDEEAYEAAIELYDTYSKISDEIGQAGGDGAERFADVADDDYANQLLREVHAMREFGLRFTGTGTVRAMGLDEINPSRSLMTVKFCEGIGDTRIVDADGADVTPADREEEIPILVSFVSTSPDRLQISGSDRWPGDDFCS